VELKAVIADRESEIEQMKQKVEKSVKEVEGANEKMKQLEEDAAQLKVRDI